MLFVSLHTFVPDAGGTDDKDREAPGLQTQEKGVPFRKHLGVLLETGPIPCVGNTEMNRLSQGAPMMLTMGGEEDIVVSFLV